MLTTCAHITISERRKYHRRRRILNPVISNTDTDLLDPRDAIADWMAEEDLLIDMKETPGFVTENAGEVTVVLDTNLSEELIEEGFVREIISKVQTMRKEAGFEVMDRIMVYTEGNDHIAEIMKANEETIKGDVLADSIVYGSSDGYVKEWSINKENVTLGVKKV